MGLMGGGTGLGLDALALGLGGLGRLGLGLAWLALRSDWLRLGPVYPLARRINTPLDPTTDPIK